MNDSAEAWGSPDREYAQGPDSNEHYSDREIGPFPDIEYQSSMWSKAVRHSAGAELQVVVQRTVKQWNSAVRESLRKQTGLRLSTDSDSKRIVARNRKVRSVPVRVVSELPIRFAARVQNIAPRDLTLLLNASKLEGVVSGTNFLEEHFQELSMIQFDRSCKAGEDEIKNVCGFAEDLLKYIKSIDQSRSILEIDEDILGAYFFNLPEIRLYWIVIGVYSQMLDIPIEALTVVVLVHELAHAYTHLGFDIDDRNWKTEDFARSDAYLVEGLAQFYTKVICEQIQQRLPTAKSAFEKLLENQHEVYSEHEKWSTDRGLRHLGETVRISMLECRSKGILQVSHFRQILKQHQDDFGRG